MLTNTMRGTEHGFSQTNFTYEGTLNGYFIVEEALKAIDGFDLNRNLN